MEYYCGIDVSLEQSSLCVVDAKGRIVREAKVPSERDALIAWFQGLDLPLSRIGLEAGPLSQWLYAGLAEAGFAAELIETRRNSKTCLRPADDQDSRVSPLVRLRFASDILPIVATKVPGIGGSAWSPVTDQLLETLEFLERC